MSNELNPNPLRDMDPAVREALGNKTRQVFTSLKPYYPQYYLVLKDNKTESMMLKGWAKALIDSRVTEEMLITGVKRAKSYASENEYCKWPRLGDFISWCHGIPSPEAAYFETSKNCHDLTEWEPSHSIVALAGRHTGFYDIRNSENQNYLKSEYIRFYCYLLSRVLSGEVFTYTKLEKPLPPPKKDLTKDDIERNQAAIAQLMAAVNKDDSRQDKPEIKEMTKQERDQKLAEMKIKAEAWKKSKDRGGK